MSFRACSYQWKLPPIITTIAQRSFRTRTGKFSEESAGQGGSEKRSKIRQGPVKHTTRYTTLAALTLAAACAPANGASAPRSNVWAARGPLYVWRVDSLGVACFAQAGNANSALSCVPLPVARPVEAQR